MQVTKELIANDITAIEKQMEDLRTSLAQASGALLVLRNMKQFLEKPDPAVEPDKPSEMNMDELAEAVAGPGAVVEKITALDAPTEPVAVIDARGKYKRRRNV